MAVERVSGGSSLIDVLDRVLDKGIVIDAWVRISLVGIDLITVEARVVVASIDTYLWCPVQRWLKAAPKAKKESWVKSGHARPVGGGKAWLWGHAWLRPKSALTPLA